MIIMSVDYGDARTGIAVCGASEMMASPVCTVFEYNFEKCVEKTAAIAKEQGAECIVVGLPLNMNGTETERAEKCRLFAEKLKDLTGIETVMWDERSTTISAHAYLNNTNTRGKKRKAVVDSVAAVIILESYLAYRKNNK